MLYKQSSSRLRLPSRQRLDWSPMLEAATGETQQQIIFHLNAMDQVPPGGADLYGAPDAPATIADALQQRMEKYQAKKPDYSE